MSDTPPIVAALREQLLYRTTAAEAADTIVDLLGALERLSRLSPQAANAATAQDLHLTVRAIADSAICKATDVQGGGR